MRMNELPAEILAALDEIGAIRRYSDGGYGFDDSKFYGRTTGELREMLSRYVGEIRRGDDAEPYIRHAARKATEWGRVAYAYAGGWFDAVKAGKDGPWVTAVLEAMWYFAEESEWVEFLWEADATGSRYGYGMAWPKYLEARGLA